MVPAPASLVVLVGAQGRARAHEVAITVRGIDTAHRRPIRRGGIDTVRERARLARVGAVPCVGHDIGGRVWRVAQRTLVHAAYPRLDGANLVADRNHGLAETIELGE